MAFAVCLKTSRHKSKVYIETNLYMTHGAQIDNDIPDDSPVLLIEYRKTHSNSIYFNLIQSSAPGIKSQSILVHRKCEVARENLSHCHILTFSTMNNSENDKLSSNMSHLHVYHEHTRSSTFKSAKVKQNKKKG